LEGLKTRAQNWGKEVGQSAQQMGERARHFASNEGATMARGAGHGIAHIIGVLFKAFFLLIAGCLALGLFGLCIGLLFGGFAFFPLKNFFLNGFWQNFLAWVSAFLFLGVPLLGLMIWLIRRILGVRSRNHYLGYIFGSLWFIGIVSTVLLFGFVGRDFKTRSEIRDNISVIQPANNILYLDQASSNIRYYGGDWFGIDNWHDWPFYGVSEDTIMLNTIRLRIAKSTDSLFHVERVKFSRGKNPDDAKNLAEKLRFDIVQKDSALILPQRFPVSLSEKFRNQQVLVILRVPVGKHFFISRKMYNYKWFNIQFDNNYYNDDEWEEYGVDYGVEYVMTPEGPKRLKDLDENDLKEGRYRLKSKKQENMDNENNDDQNYRYQNKKKKKDSVKKVVQTSENSEAGGESESGGAELSLPFSSLTRFFQ